MLAVATPLLQGSGIGRCRMGVKVSPAARSGAARLGARRASPVSPRAGGACVAFHLQHPCTERARAPTWRSIRRPSPAMVHYRRDTTISFPHVVEGDVGSRGGRCGARNARRRGHARIRVAVAFSTAVAAWVAGARARLRAPVAVTPVGALP